ncbi:acyltransferase family protein [Methylophaga thalassica]|uniref:acyltransferase family protein n=1 Tax=Methylophaga thalassica TaxID=40223 RepID=UPI00361952FA
MISRVESLDWLRGLMALTIMIYHLTSWHFFKLDSSSMLGRFGIYGVSIFFVLSGLSMAIVYSKYITDKRTAVTFYIRRVFRIWPLLWLCVALLVVYKLAAGEDISITQVFLNITTLFGFISPSDYMNTGAWSIGNEMVYYAMTPLILMMYEKNKLLGNLFLLATFIVALIFCFALLMPQQSLTEQRHLYINPFNNLFLYVAGIAIYYNRVDISCISTVIIFTLTLAIFASYPVSGDKIAIVTGVNRIIFMFASIFLVISFYSFSKWENNVPIALKYPLEQFGLVTYGIYLLHPIVNLYLGYILEKLGIASPYIQFGLTIIVTIIAALLSFSLYEKS